MEDEYPHAVRAVIRKIYGWPIGDHKLHSWEYWLSIAKTADKYLEPELVMSAGWAMVHSGFSLATCANKGDIEETCDIIDAFQELDSHPETLECAFRLATTLQRHAGDSEVFRSCLLNNPKVMLKMLDASRPDPRTVRTGLDICDEHVGAYLTRTEIGSSCLWCDELGRDRHTERYNMWYVKCAAESTVEDTQV